MPTTSPDDRPHAAIGNRLRAWREALELKQTHVVETSDGRFQPNGWSQWESGKIRISIDAALLLVDKYPGLSLDYIYRGKYEALPHDLYKKIQPRLLRIADKKNDSTQQVAATAGKKRSRQ